MPAAVQVQAIWHLITAGCIADTEPTMSGCSLKAACAMDSCTTSAGQQVCMPSCSDQSATLPAITPCLAVNSPASPAIRCGPGIQHGSREPAGGTSVGGQAGYSSRRALALSISLAPRMPQALASSSCRTGPSPAALPVGTQQSLGTCTSSVLSPALPPTCGEAQHKEVVPGSLQAF